MQLDALDLQEKLMTIRRDNASRAIIPGYVIDPNAHRAPPQRAT